MAIIIGIDPGWASCGISVHIDGVDIWADNYVPRDALSDTENIRSAVDNLINNVREKIEDYIEQSIIDDEGGCLMEHVVIERFVAYKGIHSDASEAILMFIGALTYAFEAMGSKVHLVRAIDWKPKVCKYLVRTQGFTNPSLHFDKKFSLAAASALCGRKVDSDHAADAVCLSYLPIIDEWNKTNKKSR